MRFMKKISTMLVVAALMCSTMMLGACGNSAGGDTQQGSTSQDGGKKEYKVTVKDAFGTPYTSGVIVQFLKDGAEHAMQVCDENGVAKKELDAGDYTVTLKFTDDASAYYYIEEGLTLSADKTELDVILSKNVGKESTLLYAQGNECDAYAVSTGCTHVNLVEGERNYFLFTPTEAGTYEFSIADDAKATIGYYGAPHFVQENSAAEVTDNKFVISIKDSMISTDATAGTSVYVIGIDAESGTKECVLGINRTGDPQWSLEDEPWTIYQSTITINPFTLPEGTELEDFDITAESYDVVYNEFDGYYHLGSEDGPLVYVRLTTDSPYIACFKNILDRSGVTKYFFDENGEFVKKESYSECLLKYIECADENEGVYPLTEDLKYIIQSRGEYVGWWDAQSKDFIFKDQLGNPIAGLNTEIAWLFMCCYEVQ